MNITITGIRDVPADGAERCEVLFERYLAPFAKSGHEFFVGGANGGGTLSILDYAASRDTPRLIVPL